MNRLEAHELLAEFHAYDPRELRSWLPAGVEPRIVNGIDGSVALLTAACSLSGQLDDCETVDDLQDACEHFRSLWDAEIVDLTAWNSEALVVIRELIEWGRRATAHERN